MFNPHFSISLSDLILIDKFAKAFSEDNKEVMNSILYENGMEISKGYDSQVRQHRNLQGKVVNCIRFEGVERIDISWIRSGFASMEAYVASSDPEVQKDMKNMSRQSKGLATKEKQEEEIDE